MATQRNCDSCGAEYIARMKNSRFCSDTCRLHSHRGTKPKPPAPREPIDKPESGPRSTRSATRTELTRTGQLDTWQGQLAMKLASLIDDADTMSGAAPASLARELRAAMADAIRVAPPVRKSKLDEVKARRDAKRTG